MGLNKKEALVILLLVLLILILSNKNSFSGQYSRSVSRINDDGAVMQYVSGNMECRMISLFNRLTRVCYEKTDEQLDYKQQLFLDAIGANQ